jgi:hypothetical protein
MHTLLEAHLLERAVQLGVLGPRHLPQPIQGLAQLEHLALLPRDDEAGGCRTYTSSLRLLLRKAELTSM